MKVRGPREKPRYKRGYTLRDTASDEKGTHRDSRRANEREERNERSVREREGEREKEDWKKKR